MTKSLIFDIVRDFYGSPRVSTTEGLKAFQEIAFETVARIKISKKRRKPLVGKKTETGWVVTSNPGLHGTDAATIDDIVNSLESLGEAVVVGSRADSHQDLQVDDDNGWNIELYDRNGGTLGNVVVGKSSPFTGFSGRPRQVFMRFSKETWTFRVSCKVRQYLDKLELQTE